MVASIAPMLDLPGSLRLPSTFAFVGRSAELALLERGWEQRRTVPVVTGGEACGPDGC